VPSEWRKIDALHQASSALLTDQPQDTGANASAEEAEESVEDAVQRVNNIVHSFRLTNTQFDKKSYLAYLKGGLASLTAVASLALAPDYVFFLFTAGANEYLFPGYLKTVKAKMTELGKSEDEIKEFETGAQNFVKTTLLPNFKDWEFYTGESMNPDGM
jgi:acetaldehyde dehydrogenase (acetylating)